MSVSFAEGDTVKFQVLSPIPETAVWNGPFRERTYLNVNVFEKNGETLEKPASFVIGFYNDEMKDVLALRADGSLDINGADLNPARLWEAKLTGGLARAVAENVGNWSSGSGPFIEKGSLKGTNEPIPPQSGAPAPAPQTLDA